MLQDLDKTLKGLLSSQLPAGIVQPDNIGFEVPDPESISTPGINLFLYDVRENLELRNTVGGFVRQNDGTAIKQRPPARVDCSYLITAWPSKSQKTSKPDAAEEHQMLGEVMKVLLRFPTLPEEVLQGSLKGQEPPVRAFSLRPGQLQNMGDFWQALGGKPKASLNYIVTIAVSLDGDDTTVPLVTDQRLIPTLITKGS
jgi:hypothetical protein